MNRVTIKKHNNLCYLNIFSVQKRKKRNRKKEKQKKEKQKKRCGLQTICVCRLSLDERRPVILSTVLVEEKVPVSVRLDF